MKRFLQGIIDKEKAKLLSEMGRDPIGTLAMMLDKVGIPYQQSDNEFIIETGEDEAVTVRVKKFKRPS